MQIHLDPGDGVPIYLQIVRQVKYLVAAGRLRPGEELPPIRALAERLVINPNTVARAYRQLEHEGVVVKRSTTGTFVAPAGAGLGREDYLEALAVRVDALLAAAGQVGLGPDEVCALVRRRHELMHAREGGKRP